MLIRGTVTQFIFHFPATINLLIITKQLSDHILFEISKKIKALTNI
jgi:hypothetical protein